MPDTKSVQPRDLKRAQDMAMECEREQRPECLRCWNDMPEWLQSHWIEKAQRFESDSESAEARRLS